MAAAPPLDVAIQLVTDPFLDHVIDITRSRPSSLRGAAAAGATDAGLGISRSVGKPKG